MERGGKGLFLIRHPIVAEFSVEYLEKGWLFNRSKILEDLTNESAYLLLATSALTSRRLKYRSDLGPCSSHRQKQ
jgi:hypothetical protein